MSIADEIGKIAKETTKKKLKEKSNEVAKETKKVEPTIKAKQYKLERWDKFGPDNYDSNWKWEQGDLKETEKIVKHNLDATDSHKNGTSEQRKVYNAEKQGLNRVQNEIKRRKLMKGIKRNTGIDKSNIRLRKRDLTDDLLEE